MRRIFVALAVVLALGACSASSIQVEAIEGSVTDVVTRHQAYVTADPALDATHRAAYLRTGELLLQVLAEAKGK